MIKKRYVFLGLFFLFSVMIFSTKVVDFPNHVKPSFLVVDDNYLYVSDLTTIYTYNLNNYKLVKKFGKKRELVLKNSDHLAELEYYLM